MILFRAAKLITGLRLLITTAAPIVVANIPIIVSSVALLSLRSAAYLVGVTLGSIGVTLWPWVLFFSAISLPGIFRIEPGSTLSGLEARCYGHGQSTLYVLIDVYSEDYQVCHPIKVWLQVVWASKSEFATQNKSCFLIGYSDRVMEDVRIEYNPYKLSEDFLKSRAKSFETVSGDKILNLDQATSRNLETVISWDKGYWVAEETDTECRGWPPGWSRKVK
jgi:hypothetical protein